MRLNKWDIKQQWLFNAARIIYKGEAKRRYGDSSAFETYYAVPVGSKSIELEYETNVLSDEKEIIKIQ